MSIRILFAALCIVILSSAGAQKTNYKVGLIGFYNLENFYDTIDDPKNNLVSIDDQFIHSQFWALVDKHGDVRKVYDGLKESEVKKMIRLAKRLIKEK